MRSTNVALKSEKRVVEAKTEKKAENLRSNVKKLPEEIKPKLSAKKREELILENYDQSMRVGWKMLSSWRVRMPEDEVISIVGAALCDAAYRFDPSRGVGFQTFFFYHLRGLFIKEITRIVQEQNTTVFVPNHVLGGEAEEGFSNPKWFFRLIDSNHPERILQEREKNIAVWNACSELDALEQEVLVRVFVKDEQLVSVADELNYCRCHISRVKSRALKKLKAGLVADEDSDAQSKKRYKGGRGRRRDGDTLSNAELLQDALASIAS